MTAPYYTLPGIPSDLLTSEKIGTRRNKVEPASTGFYEGRQFRMVRKLNSPIVYKYVAVVPFILFEQIFTVSDGGYEFFAWRSDNITELTPFNTAVPIFRKNTENQEYIRQNGVFSGGSISIINSNLYSDFASLITSGATAQKTSVSGPANSERFLSPGTYYLQFTGTAVGSYQIAWEENP